MTFDELRERINKEGGMLVRRFQDTESPGSHGCELSMYYLRGRNIIIQRFESGWVAYKDDGTNKTADALRFIGIDPQ